MSIHALSPELIVGIGALLVLLVDTFTEQQYSRIITGTALASVILSIISSLFLLRGPSRELFSGNLVVDDFSLFFKVAILVVSGLVIFSSLEFIKKTYPEGSDDITEFMSLVLLATIGMLVMASARTLVTAFIALELASLPSYSLVAFMKKKKSSIEGGMKYFLLGALSSAILLYGISLIYGGTGSFDLVEISNTSVTPTIILGSLLVLFGFSFKVAAVPFQLWAPDAYTGAPSTITAFVSSASKIAGFVLLFRIFAVAFPTGAWLPAAQIIAILTMTFGNFAAAVQTNVKRMLAYSSIGHAGYAFMALAVFSGSTSASSLAIGAAATHLFVYGIMNTGAFLVVALVDDYWGYGYEFKDYAGIAKRYPMIGIAMGVFLLSLAGLPVGGGFLSKLVLFGSAVNAGFWWLALIGIINSALSLYYYSRVLRFMWVEKPNEEQPNIDNKPISLYLPIAVAAIITFVLLFAFDPIVSTAIDATTILL